jgi:hypothetical protein
MKIRKKIKFWIIKRNHRKNVIFMTYIVFFRFEKKKFKSIDPNCSHFNTLRIKLNE